MNDMPTVVLVVLFLVGVVMGWISFGFSVIEDCNKIGAFTAGGRGYVCEVKK